MVCETGAERREAVLPGRVEAGGGSWSRSKDWERSDHPDTLPLLLGDPAHPARLRPSDLDDPQGFHSRLTAWLLRQV